MYIKHFVAWTNIKERIEKEERTIVVRKGEIRWAAIGVNVGTEMDGKGDNFLRPVLVLHVIGNSLALIVPITSKQKTSPGYISFEWKNRTDSLCVHQMKTISTKRILRREAKISDTKLQYVKDLIKKFYSF